jgi:hypothetical protein
METTNVRNLNIDENPKQFYYRAKPDIMKN